MPFCDSGGVRIHYRCDGNAAGSPLVLQHGFGLSLDDWYDTGFVDALGRDHRLILVDARGHGRSDKPHDPAAYRPHLPAADVVAVLDDLGVGRAHYLGYSMGGRIGFSLGFHAPDRCRSLVIGGKGPGDRSPDDPDPVLSTLRLGAVAWAEATVRGYGPWATPARCERLRRNDVDSLLAARPALFEPFGLEAALPRFAMPCLLYAGDRDPNLAGARRAAGLIPGAEFVSIAGLDHLGACFRSDLVSPRVARFLADLD